jgi:hypothetical protein
VLICDSISSHQRWHTLFLSVIKKIISLWQYLTVGTVERVSYSRLHRHRDSNWNPVTSHHKVWDGAQFLSTKGYSSRTIVIHKLYTLIYADIFAIHIHAHAKHCWSNIVWFAIRSHISVIELHASQNEIHIHNRVYIHMQTCTHTNTYADTHMFRHMEGLRRVYIKPFLAQKQFPPDFPHFSHHSAHILLNFCKKSHSISLQLQHLLSNVLTMLCTYVYTYILCTT